MFWHDAALVFSRRSSPAAMLDSPLPTRRQGDIRLPSQAASDRDLRSVSRSRAVRFVAAGDSNTRPSARSPVELDTATGWALRPGFSQSRQCPCGCSRRMVRSLLIPSGVLLCVSTAFPLDFPTDATISALCAPRSLPRQGADRWPPVVATGGGLA